MTRIQDALDQHRFVLHAQPIMDLAAREIIQHELLIRLDDPEEGLIDPGAFLPTAGAYGLAPAIDRWVITRAIGIAAAGHPSRSTPPHVRSPIPRCPTSSSSCSPTPLVDPHLLVFELTETALLENDKDAARFAAPMHEMGCQLALGGFGTGYGAFTYLKQLPVDLLEIDIEFVRDAVTDQASRHVISAIVSLARSFDTLTVAEGVEDPRTLELLAELGVDQAQGCHLGPPRPVDEGLLRGVVGRH